MDPDVIVAGDEVTLGLRDLHGDGFRAVERRVVDVERRVLDRMLVDEGDVETTAVPVRAGGMEVEVTVDVVPRQHMRRSPNFDSTKFCVVVPPDATTI